ncbi:MAG: hypothetical protein Aurels2KO_25690 [Aureliella sp.]
MLDRFYSAAEAGEMLGVDASTILTWVRSGELIASNCSKNPNSLKPKWRIAAQEICRFMLKRQNVESDPANQPQKRVRKKVKKPTQYV